MRNMQDTAPIFKDVNQALHVCFLIHSLPPGSVSPTATVIDRMREVYDFSSDGVKESKPTVNFKGLTPYEIRGQAAQVVSMVNNMQSKIESAAIKLWYGRDAIQVQGAAQFSEHAQAMIAEDKEFAKAIVAYVMPDKDESQVGTAQEIGERFGLTTRNVRYYIDKTRKLMHNYRKRGIESLEERFKDGELVGASYD